MNKELIRKSKFLSLLLRHDPGKVDLTLDDKGWASVSDILKKVGLKMSELEEVVDTNDKKRFEFDQHKLRIRARQGHSIEVDVELAEVTPLHDLYHGTASKFVQSIMKHGISKQKRQHVHLSADFQTAEKVGSRHGEPAVIVVDAVKMHEDGYKIYQSNNGVYLTDNVPPQYLKPVFNIHDNL